MVLSIDAGSTLGPSIAGSSTTGWTASPPVEDSFTGFSSSTAAVSLSSFSAVGEVTFDDLSVFVFRVRVPPAFLAASLAAATRLAAALGAVGLEKPDLAEVDLVVAGRRAPADVAVEVVVVVVFEVVFPETMEIFIKYQ